MSNGPDINQIGKSFVEHYYNLFDNNRQQLANLFVCYIIISLHPYSYYEIIYIHSKINQC